RADRDRHAGRDESAAATKFRGNRDSRGYRHDRDRAHQPQPLGVGTSRRCKRRNTRTSSGRRGPCDGEVMRFASINQVLFAGISLVAAGAVYGQSANVAERYSKEIDGQIASHYAPVEALYKDI